MTPSTPKPDQATLESIARLKNNSDFQRFTKHHQALLDYFKEVLVSCTPADVPRFQGRAAQLQDLFTLLTKDSK